MRNTASEFSIKEANLAYLSREEKRICKVSNCMITTLAP